jgi:hypothetical protein
MKKLAILAMTVLFAMAVLQTQAQETNTEAKSEMKALKKLEGTKVSELAKTHFFTDFGNVTNPVWKRSGTFDEVTFTKDGKKMTAFYDENSELVGTTTAKTFADLPAKSQQEIKTKYKDYSIGQVIFFDDNEWNETDMIMYGSQFNDSDNYFVELSKGKDRIVVRVDVPGYVYFFTKL